MHESTHVHTLGPSSSPGPLPFIAGFTQQNIPPVLHSSSLITQALYHDFSLHEDGGEGASWPPAAPSAAEAGAGPDDEEALQQMMQASSETRAMADLMELPPAAAAVMYRTYDT